MQLLELEDKNIIVLDRSHNPHCIFLRLASEDGTIVKWPNGDDKIAVDFIKTDTDFWTLATIIAFTLGMKILPCDDFLEDYGPAFSYSCNKKEKRKECQCNIKSV